MDNKRHTNTYEDCTLKTHPNNVVLDMTFTDGVWVWKGQIEDKKRDVKEDSLFWTKLWNEFLQ